MSTPPPAKTIGVQIFADCGEYKHHLNLFRVNAGGPLCEALEYAAHVLDCATVLSLEVAMGPRNARLAFAAHYLCEMGKAVLDDLNLTIQPGGLHPQ